MATLMSFLREQFTMRMQEGHWVQLTQQLIAVASPHRNIARVKTVAKRIRQGTKMAETKARTATGKVSQRQNEIKTITVLVERTEKTSSLR